ncbi:MAG: hypothetical protein LBU70_05780 [Chitinispirillales bacterium]|jgi:hypothetical protein|nr:hypothetical protein [Chitinispirillales bacterium]
MKKLAFFAAVYLLALLMATTTSVTAQIREITVDLRDEYGDSWNGAELRV